MRWSGSYKGSDQKQKKKNYDKHHNTMPLVSAEDLRVDRIFN